MPKHRQAVFTSVIFTGYPTSKAASISVKTQFITLPPPMSIPNQNNFPRRCFRRLQRDTLLRGIRPVFSHRCRGFFRFLALAAPCASAMFSGRLFFARGFDGARARANNRRGKTSFCGNFVLRKNRFSIPDRSRVVYRDDGLFFGAVKIENDTARAPPLSP